MSCRCNLLEGLSGDFRMKHSRIATMHVGLKPPFSNGSRTSSSRSESIGIHSAFMLFALPFTSGRLKCTRIMGPEPVACYSSCPLRESLVSICLVSSIPHCASMYPSEHVCVCVSLRLSEPPVSGRVYVHLSSLMRWYSGTKLFAHLLALRGTIHRCLYFTMADELRVQGR